MTTKKQTKAARPGRPALPVAERRDVVLRVKVTHDDRVRFGAAATTAGTSISTWLRQLALRVLSTR